jgi:F-type H+-transporting ATPase subunit epsilon
MKKITLEIISPEKTFASLPVTLVSLPGKEGRFGVLQGHENHIATIAPGLVEVYQDEEIVEQYIVSQGVVEITSENCTVLIDEAVKIGKINFESIEKRLEELKKQEGITTEDGLSGSPQMRYLEEVMKSKDLYNNFS